MYYKQSKLIKKQSKLIKELSQTVISQHHDYKLMSGLYRNSLVVCNQLIKAYGIGVDGEGLPAHLLDAQQEVLSQPEQTEKTPVAFEPVISQDLINDIEYIITAFETSADADDYWRPISDLRNDLKNLKHGITGGKE